MAKIEYSKAELTEMATKIRKRKDTMKTTLDEMAKKVNALEAQGRFLTEGEASSALQEKINAKKKSFEDYDAKVETYAKYLEKVRDSLQEGEKLVVENINTVDAGAQS